MGSPEADACARRIAAQQEGVITTRQLHESGLTRRQIGLRLASGGLVRLHRDVFRVGGAPLTFRARLRAALLAAGARAFASHRSAAAVWRITRDEPDILDVTVLGPSRRRLAGVRTHRTTRLPATQIRTLGGIRVSAPARVICELAATAPREEVENAVQEAAARLRLTPAELGRAAAAWRPRHGSALLDATLQVEAPNEFTRSWAERQRRRLLAQAGLPRPASNLVVGGYRVDAVWEEQRLIVLIDGLGTHGTPVAFARDRVESNELTVAGWTVLRFTARQLKDARLWVVAQIAAGLRP